MSTFLSLHVMSFLSLVAYNLRLLCAFLINTIQYNTTQYTRCLLLCVCFQFCQIYIKRIIVEDHNWFNMLDVEVLQIQVRHFHVIPKCSVISRSMVFTDIFLVRKFCVLDLQSTHGYCTVNRTVWALWSPLHDARPANQWTSPSPTTATPPRPPQSGYASDPERRRTDSPQRRYCNSRPAARIK